MKEFEKDPIVIVGLVVTIVILFVVFFILNNKIIDSGYVTVENKYWTTTTTVQEEDEDCSYVTDSDGNLSRKCSTSWDYVCSDSFTGFSAEDVVYPEPCSYVDWDRRVVESVVYKVIFRIEDREESLFSVDFDKNSYTYLFVGETLCEFEQNALRRYKVFNCYRTKNANPNH